MPASIAIWKEQIILRTDSADGNPDSWEHIGAHAKFSERLHAYTLAFSVQNLQRIFRQFGRVPVVEGQGRIEQLKSELERFRSMLKTAELAKASTSLPLYDYKAAPIGEYQHRGVVYLVNVQRSAMFADCGVGKTYMTAASTEVQIKKGMLPRGGTLVCGKLATLHQGWIGDIGKFTDLKVSCLWVPTPYKRKEKILKALAEPADIYLINHDGVRIYQKELAAKRFQKVVVDESTVLKSFHTEYAKAKGGAFGKALMCVAAYAPWRVIMTGTPASNGPQDLWGQLHFLDPRGFLLEASWRDFREEHMDTVYYGDPSNPETPKSYVIKRDSFEKIANIVNPLVYRVRIRDVLPDLPERTILKRFVDMSSTQAAHYVSMEDTMHTEVDSEHVAVTTKLAQINKLRQVTGGFLIDAKEDRHPIDVDTPKLLMLDQLVNEEIDVDQKIVIFAQYQWEFEQLAERYKEHGIVTYYGELPAAQKLANLKAFIEDPKARIFALHPQSCAHGVTLTMAHYLIFYSVSYSSEQDYQCIKRIERNGQKFPMFIYYLLARDTVDEGMFDVIQLKHHQQTMLIDPDLHDRDVALVWDRLREQVKRHKRKKRG